MPITTTKESITPKMAEEILTVHYNRIANGEYLQRKIYKSVVRKYVSDMKAGFWKYTPTPIVFDENGNLAQGQHRLEAVRQSGVTCTFSVSRGWPADVIDTEDRGKTRTVADQFRLHGMPNSIIIASSVNSIIRICYRGNVGAVSYAAASHILEKLDMNKHIDRMMDITSATKRPGRMIGPLAWYRTVNTRKAELFAAQLACMEFEKGTGPNLYAKYIRDRSPDDQDLAIRAICSCLKLWHDGKTAEFIRPNYNAVDWLADQNKILKTNIISMIGEIQ